MTVIRSAVGALAAMALAATAVAQTANYTTREATAETPLQIGVHATANKDCTPSPLPTVRVIEAPKSGTLSVKSATLTTNKIAGCPNLKTPARVVFYQSRSGYAGRDHVIYEVTSSNGQVEIYDVTVEVKVGPKPAPPSPPRKGEGPI